MSIHISTSGYTSTFSINKYINSLHVGIIDTHDGPFFYAEDLTAAMSVDLKNIRLNDKDIVTSDQRKQYNLCTYRKVCNEWHVDNTVKLLTEQGAYNVIMCSKSSLATPFQQSMYGRMLAYGPAMQAPRPTCQTR